MRERLCVRKLLLGCVVENSSALSASVLTVWEGEQALLQLRCIVEAGYGRAMAMCPVPGGLGYACLRVYQQQLSVCVCASVRSDHRVHIVRV